MPYERRARTSRKRITIRRKPKKLPNVIQRKRPWLGGMSIGQAASYATKGVSLLSGIINSELHRNNVFIQVSPASTAAVNNISVLAQGDDANQRTGNSILAKYMTVAYQVALSSTAVATNTYYDICRH